LPRARRIGGGSGVVLVRSIHATGPSGVGAVTYTDSGGPAGLTPKAVRVAWTVVTAEDTHSATARFGVGYYDGTTQRCVAAAAEHNTAAASADTWAYASTSLLVIVGDTAGPASPQTTGAAVSLGVNSVEITWSVTNTNLHMDIVFFYGGDVQARVTSIASHAVSNSAVSTTGGSFTPSMVFAASTGNAFGSGSTASSHGTLSEGFSGRLPSTTQGCAALRWDDAASPTSVANLNRDDAVVAWLSSVSAETHIEVTAWNSDGIEYTTRGAGGSFEFCVLELYFGDEIRVWAGGPLLPTSTLGAFSRTDPGFKPLALFFSHVRSGAIDTIGNTQGVMGIGYALSAAQACVTSFDRDNVATSEAQNRHTVTHCAQIIQASGAATMRISWTSFDATGWSGSVATASAADFHVPYCAIEDIYELEANDTENITDQHAMMVGLAQSETERIADEHALMVGLAQSETESISDQTVLVAFSISNAVFLVVSDTLSLVEDEDLYLGNVIIASDTERIADEHAMGGVMVFEETVNLLEGQNFAGNILLSLSETVNIAEAHAMYLGMLIVQSDLEHITEAVNFGRGLIATHGTHRGTTIQGGAEAGAVMSPHSERGTSLG
jgi:hypothetical protein